MKLEGHQFQIYKGGPFLNSSYITLETYCREKCRDRKGLQKRHIQKRIKHFLEDSTKTDSEGIMLGLHGKVLVALGLQG